ncbi:MAG TPA: Mur ligase family protein [Solirubrobacteraceae bacterium]|jgi:D-alanyl-D-alanine carboxypeptidase/UDP-N-acetylmuramyl pentapeptide synthase
MVRSTLLSDILPGWRESGIVIVSGERRLAQWFAKERELEQEPAGCIVVEAEFAGSPNVPRARAVLVVEDALPALRALAVAARERHQGRVIAVTGTIGRTTTRAMTAHVLRAHGAVSTNSGGGNLRAHVLEQMASVRPDTPQAVYEMALGGPAGSFADVSAVVRPDAVLLTEIDVADTRSRSRRDALQALARRKLELLAGMPPDGTVIVHRDAATFDDVRGLLEGRRIVTYGRDEDADYRLLGVEDAEGTSRARAATPGGEVGFTVPSGFMAVNGLGAIAAAASVGADADAASAAQRLAAFEPPPRHARPLTLTVGGAVVTVIDDTHNATVVTTRAALRLLAESEPGSGRRIAVLGDLTHHGGGDEAVHAGLAEPIDRYGVARVYTLGGPIEHLQRALPTGTRAGHFESPEALVEALATDLRAGDVIAVKASAAARFDRVVRLLRQLDETERAEAPAPARQRAPDLPPSLLLLDGDTGETLFAQDADRPHDPASLVKMMTLYLLFEALRAGRIGLEDELVASPLAARQAGSRLGVTAGQVLSLHDAILALATVSANDVAVIVAERLAGGGRGVPGFVERMNARAEELGLTGTTFRTASGIFHPQQKGTATDMGRLGFRLYTDFPGYRQWLAHPSMVFDGWRRPATNSLLTGYQGLDGIKTGTVSPGTLRHLVGSASRGGRRFIGVAMGCRDVPHRDVEMTRLLDRGFASVTA